MDRGCGARSRRPALPGRRAALAAVTALLVVLGPVGGAAQAQVPWAQFDTLLAEALDHLGRYGIVTGDPDGNLRPMDTLTRAEAAKILVVAAGQAEAAGAWTGEAPFPDVAVEAWYAGYVATARELGLVGGYPDGTFKPKGQITYAELAALTARLLGVEQLADRSWPDNYLEALTSAGLIPPELALLVPTQANQPALRGAVMVLIHYAFQHHVVDGLNYYQRTFEAPAGEEPGAGEAGEG